MNWHQFPKQQKGELQKKKKKKRGIKKKKKKKKMAFKVMQVDT